MSTSIDCIFEVVDSTDYERYYTLGVFLDESAAMAAISGDSPPYNDDNPESVTLEVRRRKIGLHPHGWTKVAERTWTRNYDDLSPAWVALELKITAQAGLT